MLVNFTLVPVEKVYPWGSPGNFRLHWFGLTAGQYWIRAGENNLFEYADHAQLAGVTRYCSYQVVRLYEDLMEMLPHILEPVPSPLVQYLSGDTASALWEIYYSWFDKNEGVMDHDRFWRVADACAWINARALDSNYLSPSANILIWSDAENVCFEWDNRTRFLNGKPAWSALYGKYVLPREQFMGEIRSFHARLMEQMEKRVEQVLAGALSPEIEIDLEYLIREQQQRCSTLDKALSSFAPTDWREAEESINQILGIK